MFKISLSQILLIICLGITSQITLAEDHGRDHDLARQALLNGDVLPLETILDKIGQEQAGTPIKIEFDHDDGVYSYKIKLLRKDGSLAKLKVDATSGKILRVKERTK